MARKVLVGGVFSLLHPGHIFFLKKARSLGTSLVVVIAHDRTVGKKKGRPAFNARKRAEMVGNLRLVDRVVIGHPTDMMKVVKKERPDVIALGYDQDIDEKELRQELKSMGIMCSVKRINDMLPGYSTSKLIKEIKES
jgi:FAD synthetase